MGEAAEQKQYRVYCNPRITKLEDRQRYAEMKAEKRQGQLLLEISHLKKGVTYLVSKNGNGGKTNGDQIMEHLDSQNGQLFKDLKFLDRAWSMIPKVLQPYVFVILLYETARLFDYLASHPLMSLLSTIYGFLHG